MTAEQLVSRLMRPRYSNSKIKEIVSKKYNITEFEVESIIRQIKQKKSGFDSVEVEKMQRDLEFYRKEYEAFKNSRNLIDDIISLCKANIHVLSEPKKEITFKCKEKHQPEVAVMLLSDLHFGFNVSSLEAPTEDMVFNQEIAEQKIKKLSQEFLSIIEEKRNTRKINELVVCFIGDIVEGNWQNINSTKDDIVRQIFSGANCIASNLLFLSKYFETVRVFCVYGNHGVIQKGQPDYVNWDYIFYRFLEEMFKNTSIKFNVTTLPYLILNIFSHKYCITHGGNIRMFYRTPYYGIETADINMKAILNKMGVSYDVLLIGHFHQSAFLPTQSGLVIMNGSLTGYTPFGFKIQRFYQPSQVCFGVHPKHRISWLYAMEL